MDPFGTPSPFKVAETWLRFWMVGSFTAAMVYASWAIVATVQFFGRLGSTPPVSVGVCFE